MGNPITILAAPAEAYQNILDHPSWRLPLAFISLVFFVLAWLGGCWNDLSEGLQWTYLLGPVLISPLIVGIVSLGSTVVLYSLFVLLSGTSWRPRAFRTLFSINAHCGIIVLLGEVVNFLLVHADPLKKLHLPLAGRFPLGLDVFLLGVAHPNIYGAVLLHSTSIFIVWYLVVLAKGMRDVLGVGRQRSIVLATTLWLIMVSSAVGVVFALGGGTTIRLLLS